MTSSGLDNARLAVLVHEVRSPVAALSAVAETFGESAPGDPARRELVRLAVAACDAVERVVMDVALASVRAELLDVRALVRESVASYVVRGSDVSADEGEDQLVVVGDAVRLRQVLDNLIANALAYGGSAPVVVRATRTDDVIRVAVSDTGPGIPAHEVERIFELGRRLSEDPPGSGLGLTLGRAIIDAHGGSLEVESMPGVGSTFTIALPASSQPDT
jgi:signal transduction histidine kinase